MSTAFLAAFLATLVVGAIALFGAAIFTTGKTTRVSAFSVALGFALGGFSYTGPATMRAAVAASGIIGAVAALTILWAWLLRKG